MLKCFLSIIFFILLFVNSTLPQTLTERYNKLGEMFVVQLSTSPFPHVDRITGHIYNNKTYSAGEHYSDSSVAIFIPKGFKPKNRTDFVVYFHGWYNNIDSACNKFRLIEQFSESKKNAIFVFPEGPKNAPDSFGGKLEERYGLKYLMADVIQYLKLKNKIKSDEIGRIILAGHSGAYRVISFCLMHGGLTQNISDIILFDALYGQIDKYIHWITNFDGRFIDIYTDNGGTKSETERMINFLEINNINFIETEEAKLTLTELKKNRLIFIHSDLTHNEVISKRNQFRNYLISSKLDNLR